MFACRRIHNQFDIHTINLSHFSKQRIYKLRHFYFVPTNIYRNGNLWALHLNYQKKWIYLLTTRESFGFQNITEMSFYCLDQILSHGIHVLWMKTSIAIIPLLETLFSFRNWSVSNETFRFDTMMKKITPH